MSLPDSEVLIRNWAISKSSITDLVSQRIATNLPEEPTLPFVVITLLGGSIDNRGEALIGESDFQFDAYAGNYGGDNTKRKPDYATAYNVANTIMAEAFAQKGKKVAPGFIYGFIITQTVTRMDEEEVGLARYRFDATMQYRSLN